MHTYTLHLPEQDSYDLTTEFRITGIDNPEAVSKWLTTSTNRPLHCGYMVSKAGDLHVTVYACDIASWSDRNHGVAFTFREMLLDIVPRGAFRFPASAGEEPTLVWHRDVENHEAPKLLTADGIGYALGRR